MLELALTASTVALTYVTATPLSHRRKHAEMIRGASTTVWILCRHHGRWILWQVTTFLPRKRS